MFRFEYPIFLQALALLPLLLVVYLAYRHWRKRAMARLGDRRLVEQLMPGASKYKHPVKFGLLLLALAFIIVGWANPQWGSKREKVQRKSVDVFIALDISNSMYVQDIPPDRMGRAKKFAEDLVMKLKGERIGLILFAGGAYLQMPITTDYAAALMFINSASPELAGTQGTDIGEAIHLARRSFLPDNQHHKALVLITDGEDHISEALNAAKLARNEGIIQFTVGVGTEDGGPIPLQAARSGDYKRDETGQPIRSRLNEAILKQLAETGDGAYFHISQGNEVVNALQARIDKMEKQAFEERSFTSFESYFQYFLAAGLLLLLVESLITYRREKWLEGRDIFG